MKVVIVEPNKPAYVTEIGDDYQSLHDAVSGLIEPIYYLDDPRAVMVGNEEAKLIGLEGNRRFGDRIVAGTYLFAALAAGGDITLEHVPIEQLDSVCDVLTSMGAQIAVNKQDREIHLNAQKRDQIVNLPYIETDVYPAFPTDLQSPLIAAACVAKKRLVIKEKIFSSRYKIVEELQRMGAKITVQKDTAIVEGGRELEGRAVIAKELRGGAALVIAGLCASGITTIADSYFIKRGYQDIAGDLSRLGARISYVDR